MATTKGIAPHVRAGCLNDGDHPFPTQTHHRDTFFIGGDSHCHSAGSRFRLGNSYRRGFSAGYVGE
ncbi:Uncharacterised protein [Vibrio cholerae]|uniref:Uncharacterized protein n=1 Tax=Vibrio cholerae TaxID=666 RepID=A0A655UW68_VIBCL|nr:Uncharacterised protein [Vibrio cholerae]CSB57666.1 Uncharacterised protein [Vibrio cholerae]CSD13013.1 Uncharacterised protein [Vibrio cholerae]